MEEIVDRCGTKMFRVAAAVLHSKEEAEDAVQDAFVKLVEKRPRFESPEHELAWLIRVTVNICKNYLRSPWRKATVPLTDDYPTETENERDSMELLASLPPKYRSVVHLLYYDGYSVKETARILHATESAVRKRHSRACAMLRDTLKGEYA